MSKECTNALRNEIRERNENIEPRKKRNFLRTLSSVARFRDSVHLNAINFLTGTDKLMINPIFELLSSRAIRNIPNTVGYL